MDLGNFNSPRQFPRELRSPDAWPAPGRVGKDGKFVFTRAKGCDTCGGSGYKGRVGLHELMIGTEPQKKLIVERARVVQLVAQALEDGMLTLKMDGLEKSLQGVTDLKQVRAVCIK